MRSLCLADPPFLRPRIGLLAAEDFESYEPTDAVAGGNGGTGWSGAWVEIVYASPIAVENFEGYTINESVSGQSGGIGWSGNWTTH
jgi:hypothetical protein